LTAAGVAAGAGVAMIGTRFLRSVLFGVTPLDATAFIGVAAGFAVVAAIASVVPARRAMAVDPMEALRSE